MSPGATMQLNYKLQRENFALDVDIEVPTQGITAVFGPSGAGKTTLLRCIAGLEKSAGGTSRSVQERNIGYVFQEPRLFDHLSVRANIEYGQKRRSNNGGPDFDHVIELLGLQKFLSRSPSELSGGEAQRVAIARALMSSPKFVLMDEPLASLDQARRDEILPFLDRLHVESQVPIIYVSHNIDEVCRLCDHLVVIESGRVVADGELQDVLVRMDIPALGGDQSGSVIEGIAREHDAGDDLTRLAFSGGDLWVPGRAAEEGSSLRLRIRASDVSLCRSMPEQSTILNILPTVVEAIQPGNGPSMLVRLKLGDDRIVARVTRRSIRELGLQVSDQVFAQIKSVAVRSFCIPRNAVNYL
jgi:molybdate transport system ATP-binding protein